jgi:arylsulfatase A
MSVCRLKSIAVRGVTLLFAVAVVAIANAAPAADSKPNIILILSDDVGIADVHCFGGHYRTPNIDALAGGGTRFTYCYSTPLCGPSRCQLLTGQYPFRTGLVNNDSASAISPSREIMIPTVLKRAGYVTASVGKWGQMSLGPGQWGFDEYLVFPGSGRYWREQTKFYTVDGEQRELAAGQYLPDIMHRFAADFIARYRNQPFFLYYPMSHIHGPIVRTPDSKPGEDEEQLYADNIEYMDNLVGRLMQELDRQHLREKTLVIFTGDNGTAKFGIDQATVNGRHIFGAKGALNEGGSRVPLIVNWPGVTPKGKVNKDLIDFSDFFVTFAEVAGARLPKGVPLDGHSFAAQVHGEEGSPRKWLYVELNGRSYARNAGYKLTSSGQLFDMSQAPFEEIPVAPKTKDAAVIAAREQLQRVLDEHPAAAPSSLQATKRSMPRPKRALRSG